MLLFMLHTPVPKYKITDVALGGAQHLHVAKRLVPTTSV